MAETETIMLRGIPPRLKAKIRKRVERDESNMNDVLVGILAAAYRVRFTPTGARRLEVGPSGQALLTVPATLKRKLAVEAAEANDTIRNVAMRTICADFDVPFEPTGRWTTNGTGARRARARKTTARA